MMKITASNLTINVRNLDRSIDFYKTLGFTVKQRWGEHYAQLTGPDLTIGLHPTTAERVAGNSGNVSIGFTVTDFEGVPSFLEGQGIAVQSRSEEGGSFLHFTDPDGTSIYVIRPR